MSISLNTVVVGTFRRMLPQALGLIAKAEDHCKANGISADAFNELRIAPDMWPFAKQISECAHHSSRAIESVREGSFSPEIDPVPSDFASMRKEIEDAIAFVNSLDPAELDAIAGNDITFRAGKFEMPYTVSDFLLTFTLPNFYFHLTTAYNILRGNGVHVGKMDFLGKMRGKQ